jgi:hypothetical protein
MFAVGLKHCAGDTVDVKADATTTLLAPKLKTNPVVASIAAAAKKRSDDLVNTR